MRRWNARWNARRVAPAGAAKTRPSRAKGAGRARRRNGSEPPLTLPDHGELLGIAERVLERAMAQGAEAADVFVQADRSIGIDVERSALQGGEAGHDLGLGVRVQKDGKVGFGHASDERDAKRAIASALLAAPHHRRESLLLAGPRKAPALPGPDARILALEIEEVAARTHAMVQAAREVHKSVEVTAGGVGAGSEAWALANSRGLRHEEHAAGISAFASAVVQGTTLSTGSESEALVRDEVDFAAVGRAAGALALAGRRPKPVRSGPTTVLMRPEAMQELLEFGCINGLMGENLRRKLSPYAGKEGKRVAVSGFSLADDGTLPDGLGSAERDDEGLPSQRTALIDKGRMVGGLYDLRSARRSKAKATASALRCEAGDGDRGYDAPPRAAGRNLVVEGSRKLTKPFDDLVAETKRGLVVHEVIGAHTANPTTGEFHVNASLVFRIERGEVAGPAKSVMMSGSVPDWLRRLSGLSAEATDLDAYLTPAALRLPWMRVDKATVHA